MRSKFLTFYFIAIVLGVLCGTVGSCFILVIRGLTKLLGNAFEFMQFYGWPIQYISAIVSMLMVYVAWLLVRLYAPDASGSGVQEIEGALSHKRPISWRRVLPVKFVGGVLALSAQLVVGREGPTIQLGGNLGAMMGELLRMSRHHRDTFIAAGAAAGLATAFNAPLAGILFVIEEMREEFPFSFTSFSVVAISCVFATIVLHMIIGPEPAILMSVFDLPSLRSLGLFFIFGMVVGLVGLLFNIVLMKSLYGIDKLSPFMRDVYVLLVGFLIGYLVYLAPGVVGEGYEIIKQSLTIYPSFAVVSLLIVIRFVATMLSYSTGVPGGIFAPMMALGTLLGLAASHVFQWLMNDMTLDPGMFAVAGMGALFASTVRAPLTGIVLVVEMTQNYSLILPLMVTCLTANAVVQLSKKKPIYILLLDRTMKKSGKHSRLGGAK